MKKINIGYMISYVSQDGPPNILYNIVKYLPKEKYNIYLFIIDKNKKYIGNDRFVQLGIEIIYLDLNMMETFYYDINKLNKIIKEKNIQILHGHCLRSCFLLSKLKSCKTISTIHCNIRQDFKLSYGTTKGKLMELLYFHCLKKINFIICCSESVKNDIERYNKKLKFDFIRNGVDISKFCQMNGKKDLRKKLNLEENTIYFISVGYLIKRKGMDFLAVNFSKLKLKNSKLIILGSSKENKEIEREIRALGDKNIILKGYVKNVGDYLNAADYFVSSSLYEGLPNSVLEACCAKLPLLLSDIGPHREIFELNKKIGQLYKLGDDLDFSEKLLKLLKNNYNEMSNYSYEIVSNFLNSELMSKKYQELYEKALK